MKSTGMKRIVSILLATALIFTLVACGGNNTPAETEAPINTPAETVVQEEQPKNPDPITITLSGTPNETQEKALKAHNDKVAAFMAEYPHIEIVSDSNSYGDAQIFMLTAAANQLPTRYQTPFTDVNLRVESGYARDIKGVLESTGALARLNPDALTLATGENGEIYGYPSSIYAMGLNLNKDLFIKAGLVNEDGSIMVPQTYDELAEYASIIKEKTGVAGFAMGTTSNIGGWHGMNIFWSHGVNFMEMNDDGSYTATFNTPEAVAALQWIKDLKWKYDALPSNEVLDLTELLKLFGTNQAAMVFCDGPNNSWKQNYGMNPESIVSVSLPAGPAGRYAQTGGTMLMFAPNATDEQVEACIKYSEFTGGMGIVDENTVANLESTLEGYVEQGRIILPVDTFPIYKSEEYTTARNTALQKYANIPFENVADYVDFSKVTMRAEEPVCAQELYAVLDRVIQEVINNENADCAALIAQANEEFQVNHLDKR